MLSTALLSAPGLQAQTFWDLQVTDVASYLVDVDFVDNQAGFAVGTGGTILKTTNGGVEWTALNAGNSNDLRGVQFTSPAIGWVVGHGGIIMKTTDSGATWTIFNAGSTILFENLFFLDAFRGWVCGFDTSTGFGVVYKTIDGGATWTVASATTIDAPITSIDFISAPFG